MEIVASLIKLFFGSKADKDRKQIEPYLEKIKAVCPSIEALSNDELRARSEALKKQIADFIARRRGRHRGTEGQTWNCPKPRSRRRSSISKEIDETTKRIDEKIEEKLDEILPEAFAIMKDTARRFAQNDEVVVTANDFDRDLAAEKDFVRIEGDKAVYANHWMAGGNDAEVGHDPLRRTAVRRRGAPQGQDRRDGDGRRKDPRGDAPRIPQRAGQEGRAPGHGQQLPGQARLGVDGPDVPVPRAVGSLHRRHAAQLRRPPQGIHGRHHLRHEQRIRLRLPARQHGLVARRPGTAQAPLRHRRRGRLGADRRRPYAAHHLRPGTQRRRPALRAVLPGHRPSLQPAEKPRDGPAGRGTPAYLGGQERRGRREALPCPQGPAQVQAADQIPLGNGRQGTDAEDREHLHAGQQPPYAGDHRRPVLRHRRKTQFGGTDRQGTRGAVEIFQRGRVLRAARHRRRGGRAGEEQPLGRGACAEARPGGQRLFDQVGARAHDPPAAESLRHVRERRRIRGDGQQGEDRRRADGAYPRRTPLFGRPAPGHRGQGAREGRGCDADLCNDHAAELLPHVPQAGRYDRYGRNRGFGVLEHLQTRRRGDPDEPPGDPRRPPGFDLQDQAREIQRRDRGDREAGRGGPPGAGGHHLGRDFGVAEPHAQAPRHQA